jgi:hypothetical protein
MSNPFRLRWLQGWTFQLVLMEGKVQVEAHGFGICLRTALFPGESPQAAADRLVLAEDKRRRALHQAWIRGQDLTRSATDEDPALEEARQEGPGSLVVVHPQPLAA